MLTTGQKKLNLKFIFKILKLHSQKEIYTHRLKTKVKEKS